MVKIIFVVFILLVIIIPSKNVGAIASVGIGTGKIEVAEPLEINVSNKIDSVVVYNDGDSTGSFEMKVMFNEKQPEHKPKAEWISFSPKVFDLEGGAAQIVEISVNLPANTEPGEYFAYLEANIIQKSTSGDNLQTSITATAATKLSFFVSESINTEIKSTSTYVNDPITNLDPILFDELNDYFKVSDKTINNLFSNSSIL